MPVNLNPNESEPGATHFPSAPSRPAETSCTAFHYYLELVCGPLRGVAPAPWVDELRAELSGHLDSLVEAYEELGEDREAAVNHACRHLGDPEALGQQWAAHWAEKRPEPFRATVRMAFTHFAVAAAIGFVLCLLSMKPLLGGIVTGDLLRIWGIVVLPLHAGILLGRRSRGRRGPAAAAAIVVLAGVIALLGMVLPGSDPSGLRPFLWQVTLVYTLPLGTAAAAITGRLQERKRRQARLAG